MLGGHQTAQRGFLLSVLQAEVGVPFMRASHWVATAFTSSCVYAYAHRQAFVTSNLWVCDSIYRHLWEHELSGLGLLTNGNLNGLPGGDAGAAAAATDSKSRCRRRGSSRCADSRAPKDHINIRILLTTVSGIPLVLGLGTRMSKPYVYVDF